MGHPQRTPIVVAATVALLLAPAGGRGDSARPEGAHPSPAKAGSHSSPAHALVQVASPPFSEGIFPCSSCHADLEKNGTRRELAFHDEQQSIFDHGADQRWCLDCHDLANRDVLRLASGEPVPFTESYRLCGQCHGDKYRDWRAGIHGKRVGRWDGEKSYFLCVNCHNPHSPRFKGVQQVVVDGKKTVAPTLTYLKPEPRPKRPEEQRR